MIFQMFRRVSRAAHIAGLIVASIGCVFVPSANARDPFPSTYRPANESFAIVGATILTAEGPQIDNGTLVVIDGRVAAVGVAATVPVGVTAIDGRGKWVTPGLIDIHSHLGAMSLPQTFATSGAANEMSSPNTAEAWIEHSIRVDDPSFARARESGITALQILPGSTNVIGGRSVTLKNVPSVSVEGMKLPGAPHGVKMACGENAAFAYGAQKKAPMTPMESMAIARNAFIAAENYRKKWQEHRAQRDAKRGVAPERDLQLETLAGVLDGSIRLNVHCYRSDQMVQMINLSHEFGFKITTFHHATDAYRIADLLTAEHIGVASWADMFGPQHKIEAFNGIPENGAFIQKAGGLFAVHSDSEALIQHLHSSAGRLMALSGRMGWPVSPAEAIRWLTLNPARLIGVDREVGSLAIGKAGDVVLWNRDPFSIYSLAEMVFIDGGKVFDRSAPLPPDSDFGLGLYRRSY